MKFRIIITNNEEGKVILNTEANAIIAGIHEEEGKSHSLAATHCKGGDLLGTLDAALTAIKGVINEHPILKMHFMKKSLEILNDEEEDE